jgi:hypothetical protein
VTFDEIAPCSSDVFECAGGKEMDESIFVDEGLHGIDGDEDEPLFSSTSSLEHVLTSILEAEVPQTTTSSTAAVEASRLRGRLFPSRELPLTFRRHIHLSRS